MKLPLLADAPPWLPLPDLHRLLEAALAGLHADPPDAFLDDLMESRRELERLLLEIEQECDLGRPSQV